MKNRRTMASLAVLTILAMIVPVIMGVFNPADDKISKPLLDDESTEDVPPEDADYTVALAEELQEGIDEEEAGEVAEQFFEDFYTDIASEGFMEMPSEEQGPAKNGRYPLEETRAVHGDTRYGSASAGTGLVNPAYSSGT